MFGTGRFAGPYEIEITLDNGDIRVLTGGKILIAVGTRPYRPADVPFNRTSVLDSDEIVEIPRLPRSLAVTLVESRERFLEFVDHEPIEDFNHQLRDRGMAIRLGSAGDRIIFRNDQPVVTLENGRTIRSDMVPYAAGRVAATDSLNLSSCGIETDDRGRIKVDPNTFQTAVPHIYAAGDAIGFPSLASTSMEQGRISACHALGLPMSPAPEFFPYGIYAVREISTVGMSEEEVRRRGIHYECGIARFRETSRGHIMGLNTGMMKLIFSLKTRGLLGAHIVGEGATELVHIGQAVLNLKGTLNYFIENTYNYPTLAEAKKTAALNAWNRMPATGG